MKKVFFVILFLHCSFGIGQVIINGVIKDANANQGLSYASIRTPSGMHTVSNSNGTFQIEVPQDTAKLLVNYPGYNPKTIVVDGIQEFHEILLIKEDKGFKEAFRQSTHDGNEIIRKAIANKSKNDPERSLESFSLKNYNKVIATADPSDIDGQIDSVFIKKRKGLKYRTIDSTGYKLKKQLNTSHLFITEKVSSITFNQEDGRHETILGSKVSGFEKPVYEVLGLKIQSFSFYHNKYTLFGTDYTSPLSEKALKKYSYRILDTITTNKNPAYLIHFYAKKSRKSATPEGLLYIDINTYAIQKGIIELKGIINITASQEFRYDPEEKVWFPDRKEVQIAKGSSKNTVNLFGGVLQLTEQSEKEIDTTKTKHTNYFDASEVIKISIEDQNYDISLNTPVVKNNTKFRIEVDEKATNQTEAFWTTNRTEPITIKERNAYPYADSITKAKKAERKIKLIRKLLVGYFPLGPFDLDTKSVIKYNNYEGFRLGAGLTTNNKFSNILRFNTYGAFGTKDQDFKYGLGGAVRLHKNTSMWLGFDYIDDLVETGSTSFITDTRAFAIFEPRLFNISMFQNSKRIATHLTYDFNPRISSKIRLQKADIIPKYNYSYLNEGMAFETYKITTATFGIQWTPYSRYMLTSEGKKTIKNSFPQFSLQYTQAVKGLLDGYFTFSKLDFKATYKLTPLDKGRTNFLINAGLGLGDIPLTHLYQTAPNQPDGTTVLQRFSVGGGDSFETMFFNEFFSDKYFSLQAKHYFKRTKIIGKLRPEFGIASRFAIGDIKDSENHQSIAFNSLNRGYMESGFEINRILKGFGLSFMYRHGAYHLPRFEDNVSLKFTYYFSFGF
ncbi:DUF5686 family protein [Zhouia amylolytica]|uniref:DUF5686 family protein n=1 Tax=Zhouia amylolytica TaxID=376730 RepID=UPI0020CD37BF|nr:DUF5686 family protein [Zhouia amylolytica]MCQ0110348.1 carboxypeptidase-like regulatory domain-containing protein [Zhouia amylolytica]